MKQLFISFFLIVLSSSLFSQVNKKSIRNVVDSLNYEIQKSEDDSLKTEHLIVIADIFQNKNPDSSLYYAEKALILAEECSNLPVQVGALGFISGSLVRKGNLPKALEMAFRALGLGKGIPVRLAAGIGPSYWYLGEIYREIGDYNRAMQFYKKVIALGDDDIMGVAIGNYGLATLYEKANKLDSAIFFLDESYHVFSTLHFSHYPEVYDVYPPWYNTRASIYIKQNKPQLALKDLFTSLEMTINNDESYHTSNTYNHNK